MIFLKNASLGERYGLWYRIIMMIIFILINIYILMRIYGIYEKEKYFTDMEEFMYIIPSILFVEIYLGNRIISLLVKEEYLQLDVDIWIKKVYLDLKNNFMVELYCIMICYISVCLRRCRQLICKLNQKVIEKVIEKGAMIEVKDKKEDLVWDKIGVGIVVLMVGLIIGGMIWCVAGREGGSPVDVVNMGNWGNVVEELGEVELMARLDILEQQMDMVNNVVNQR